MSDGDDFFLDTSGDSGSLNNIFQSDQPTSARGSSSNFKYVATPRQKQPAQQTRPPAMSTTPATSPTTSTPTATTATTATPAAKPLLLIFLQVTATKSDGNSNQNVGAMGLALLANSPTAVQLMMYKNPKDPQVKLDVTMNLQWQAQENGTATFTDRSTTWSISFKNAEDARQFFLYICISKFMVAGSQFLVSSDFISGKGKGVKTGDILGIKYTGWILNPNGKLGELVETNTDKETNQRVDIGSNTNLPAWNEGLVDTKRGTKRVLVVPSSLAHGKAGHGKIPPNANLVYEVEVLRLKRATNAPETEIPPASLSPPPTMLSSRQDDIGPVVPQSGSQTPITQQPSIPIDTGMLGTQIMIPQQGFAYQQQQPPQQQFLPVQQFTQTFPTQQTSLQPPQPQVPQPQPLPPQVSQPLQPQPIQPSQTQSPPAQPMHSAAGAINALVQQGQMSTNEAVKTLVTEKEFRNDVKSNIINVVAKLEEVNKKVDEIRAPPGKAGEAASVSGMLIIQALQRLVDESDRQKREISDKDDQIATMRRKIEALQDRNERHHEDSSRMFYARDEHMKDNMGQLHEQIAILRTEKSRLEVELAQCNANSTRVTSQLQSSKQDTSALEIEKRTLQESNRKLLTDLNELKELKAKAEEKQEKLNQKLTEEMETTKKIKTKRDELEMKLEECQSKITKCEKEISSLKKKYAAELKKIEATKEEEEEEHTQAVTKYRKQIAASKEEIVNLEKKLQDAKAKAADTLREQTSELSEQIQKLTKERDEARQNLETTQQQLQLLTQKYTAAEEAHKNEIIALDKTLKSQHLVTKKKLAVAEKRATTLETKIKQLEEEKERLTKEVGALKVEHDASGKAHKESLITVETLKQELSALRIKCDEEREQAISRLKTEHNLQCEKNTASVQRLQLECDTQNSLIQKLKEENETQKVEIIAHKKEIEMLSNTSEALRTLKHEKEELEKELQGLQSRLSLQSEEIERKTAQLQEYTTVVTERNSLIEQVRTLSLQSQEMERHSNDEIVHIRAQVTELTDKLHTTTSDHEQLDRQLQQAKKDLELAIQQHEESMNARETDNAQLALLHARIHTLEAEVPHPHAVAKISTALSDSKEYFGRVSSHIQELEADKERLATECAHLNLKIEEFSKVKASTNDQTKEYYERCISELNSVVGELKEKFQQHKLKHKACKSNRTRLGELESRLQATTTDSPTSTLSEITHKLEHKEKELAQLHEMMKVQEKQILRSEKLHAVASRANALASVQQALKQVLNSVYGFIQKSMTGQETIPTVEVMNAARAAMRECTQEYLTTLKSALQSEEADDADDDDDDDDDDDEDGDDEDATTEATATSTSTSTAAAVTSTVAATKDADDDALGGEMDANGEEVLEGSEGESDEALKGEMDAGGEALEGSEGESEDADPEAQADAKAQAELKADSEGITKSKAEGEAEKKEEEEEEAEAEAETEAEAAAVGDTKVDTSVEAGKEASVSEEIKKPVEESEKAVEPEEHDETTTQKETEQVTLIPATEKDENSKSKKHSSSSETNDKKSSSSSSKKHSRKMKKSSSSSSKKHKKTQDEDLPIVEMPEAESTTDVPLESKHVCNEGEGEVRPIESITDVSQEEKRDIVVELGGESSLQTPVVDPGIAESHEEQSTSTHIEVPDAENTSLDTHTEELHTDETTTEEKQNEQPSVGELRREESTEAPKVEATEESNSEHELNVAPDAEEPSVEQPTLAVETSATKAENIVAESTTDEHSLPQSKQPEEVRELETQPSVVEEPEHRTGTEEPEPEHRTEEPEPEHRTEEPKTEVLPTTDTSSEIKLEEPAAPIEETTHISEPVVTVDTVPTTDTVPIIEPVPTTEPVVTADTVPITEPAPTTETVPIIEPVPTTEPVTTFETVSEPEPVPLTEPTSVPTETTQLNENISAIQGDNSTKPVDDPASEPEKQVNGTPSDDATLETQVVELHSNVDTVPAERTSEEVPTEDTKQTDILEQVTTVESSSPTFVPEEKHKKSSSSSSSSKKKKKSSSSSSKKKKSSSSSKKKSSSSSKKHLKVDDKEDKEESTAQSKSEDNPASVEKKQEPEQEWDEEEDETEATDTPATEQVAIPESPPPPETPDVFIPPPDVSIPSPEGTITLPDDILLLPSPPDNL